MKKLGFTLAEVLITLAIIGVIAAITLPTLMSDTTSAQIGPKLAKAVSMFEQANEVLLNANSVDSLTEFGIGTDDGNLRYTDELAKYLKFSLLRPLQFLAKDGVIYNFTGLSNWVDDPTAPPHQQRLGDLAIDIDGLSGPGRDGTDVFHFTFWNDGSLRPRGAVGYDGSELSAKGASLHWEVLCPKAENGVVQDYKHCAGHIFENNLRVLYR